MNLKNSIALDINMVDISKQANINIGTIGHVSHGKSTLVNAITGTKTMRFKQEQERNLTIKLGYANAKIFKCDKNHYKSGSSAVTDMICDTCCMHMTLVRHVSFVDTPGHEVLMATMINGASIMDGALLLVAANENCPQPQTSEHLCAIEIMKMGKSSLPIAILQNKIDIVRNIDNAKKNYNEIKAFIKSTIAEDSPIIPISAQMSYNTDMVCRYLVNLPVPERDLTSPPLMTIIRSFDINKPGCDIDDLKGGVVGGSLSKGILTIGDEFEIKPGMMKKVGNEYTYTPLRGTIVSMYTEQNELESAGPGGLIGIGTTLDPSMCKSDYLVGHVFGLAGTLPNVYTKLELQIFLLKRVLGTKIKVTPLSSKETITLNVGTMTVGSKIDKTRADLVRVTLVQPVCVNLGDKVAISRRIDGQWRLIGWGKILSGK